MPESTKPPRKPRQRQHEPHEERPREKRRKPSRKRQPRGQIILHEDRDIIVVDKAPGLLTMGTDTEKVDTAYYRLTNYVRKGNPKSRARVFIVHRLDREVSGILVFARSPEAKQALQMQWARVEKHYLALVRGRPSKPEGTLSSYLVENGVHKVYSTRDRNRGGKLAHTAYKLVHHSNGVSLLDISLLTGRKHQIRVQLADCGLPIIGDAKYGDPAPGERRIALHAMSLAFDHPHSGQPCYFETRVPGFFSRLIRFAE